MRKTKTLSTAVYVSLFIFSLFAYDVLTVYSVNLFWTSPPISWLGYKTNWLIAFLWFQSVHLIALMIASLPFALALYFWKFKHAIAISFSLALIGLALPALLMIIQQWPTPENPYSSVYSAKLIASIVLDIAKFSFSLPVLTWLIIRISSSSKRASQNFPN